MWDPTVRKVFLQQLPKRTKFSRQPNLHNASHAILRISIQTQESVIRLFHLFQQFETFICVRFSVFMT